LIAVVLNKKFIRNISNSKNLKREGFSEGSNIKRKDLKFSVLSKKKVFPGV